MNVIELIKLIQFAQNPEDTLRQMVSENPLAAQAMKMVDGKSPQQINQIAANMAKEQGIDYNAFSQQLKKMLGM